jgi:hypothetical protein
MTNHLKTGVEQSLEALCVSSVLLAMHEMQRAKGNK